MNALRFSPYRSIGIVLMAFVAATLTTSVGAATYFIDYVAGADTNTGTATTAAWQHCPGDPSATGNAAFAILAAGDTVVFKGGVTYVLSGSAGIALRWSGASTARITYDGNSAGTWGTGRAKFTDNYGAKAIVAFSATAPVAFLNFTSLEFAGIGGAATLPTDSGSPVAARPGGGIQFSTVNDVTIDKCVFHDLGYWFNQKPMNAAAIAGNAISFTNGTNVSITSCEFYHLPVAIEMYTATALSNIVVSGCRFHDSVCWTIDLPPVAGSETNVNVSNCAELNNDAFTAANWTGYGPSPRTDAQTAIVGRSVTFTVTAASTPRATYQWKKNGAVISGATSATLTFSAVAPSDAGTYTVLATNNAGATVSNDAQLTVIVPPAITTQPTDQTALALSTVTFTVAASGTPAPTYQWLKNGTAVPGWTNATLTLPGVTTNDVASYAAVATNAAGSATSNTVGFSLLIPTTPPTFTTQPVDQSATAGSAVQFTVAASGTPTPTYQWTKNGVAIAGATNTTLSFPSVTRENAATYAAIATNSAGTVTSTSATLTLTPVVTVPVITTQPVSQTVPSGSAATFTVVAAGSPPLSYKWIKNDTPVAGWTNATLTLAAVTTSDVARYTVIVSNSAGAIRSNMVTLNLSTTSSTSSVVTSPSSSTSGTSTSTSTTTAASGSSSGSTTSSTSSTSSSSTTSSGSTTSGVTSGTSTSSSTSTATSSTSSTATTSTSTSSTSSGTSSTASTGTGTTAGSASTSSTSTVSGSTSSGTTSGTSTSSSSTTSSSTTGTSTTSGSTASGTSSSSSTTSSSTPSSTTSTSSSTTTTITSQLSNVSVRAIAGSGSRTLTVGFVVRGAMPKPLLIRAVGSSLSQFGLPSVLPDPVLSLYGNSKLISSNTGWTTSPDATRLANLSNIVGAFALANGTGDSALMPLLPEGAYTAQITSAGGLSGTALLEVYDTAPRVGSRLVNVSVMTNVTSSSDLPIIGFVVTGTTPKRLLIRAVGPSLLTFRVERPMVDPKLEIYAGDRKVAENDNWSGDAALSAAFSQVGAFPFNAANTPDAAVILTANPGAYSAVVSGVGGATGMVMLEVYELP